MLGAKGKTKDTDLGREEILKQLALADGAYVDVGLFDHEEHPDSEYTIAQIGAVHEFGTKDGHIPERSFLRSTYDERREKWRARMDAAYDEIKEGKGKVLPLLMAWGEKAAGDVRRKITKLKTPPKAPATLKKEGEGFTNPLIWLGYMRQSVRARIVVGGKKKMTAKGESA